MSQELLTEQHVNRKNTNLLQGCRDFIHFAGLGDEIMFPAEQNIFF